MIPDFDAHGLLPEGIWPCTLDAARERLCCNDHRARLWDGLLRLLAELQAADLCYPIFLAGGFVSAKPMPDDIDLVHDLRHAHAFNQFRGATLFFRHRARIAEQYGVDYCVNLPGNNDFSCYFQYIGPKAAAILNLPDKHPRGILSIWSTEWRNGWKR